MSYISSLDPSRNPFVFSRCLQLKVNALKLKERPRTTQEIVKKVPEIQKHLGVIHVMWSCGMNYISKYQQFHEIPRKFHENVLTGRKGPTL